jgi:4-azaleucine resistance transporter AzlC
MTEKIVTRQTFLDGCKSGIPIAIGYVPIAIAFGLLAKSVGVLDHITILLSLFVFAGASQFMAVQMVASGVYVSEIIFTTFILNLRHFLMTASLGQRLEPITYPWRFLLSFGVTDETFSVSSLQKTPVISKKFQFGLNLIAYSFWNIGTLVGLFLSSSIPTAVQQSMGIALYAMFIGLLMPSIRESYKILVVVLVAVMVQVLFTSVDWFSNGWRIILATICRAGAGALLFREEQKSNES